jgi:hypothetical protein
VWNPGREPWADLSFIMAVYAHRRSSKRIDAAGASRIEMPTDRTEVLGYLDEAET